MDAKDFIFPGVIFGLVVIISIGLLLTNADKPTQLVNTIASSTISTSTIQTASSTGPSSAPSLSKAQPYGSVTLALGQAAFFEDGTSIRPMHILEDSRCPKDVQCIQAGTVRVSFVADSKGKTSVQTLSIGKSVNVNGDTITLDSVEPQKMKAGYPAASAYRFTFTVKHG